MELLHEAWLVQSLGVLAMALGCLSFQCKTQRAIAALQAVAALFWAAHFLLLGAVTGAISNLFSVPRNFIYAKRDKAPWAGSIAWPIIFSVIFAAGGVYSRVARGESWIFLLSVFAQVMSSWVLRIRDAQRLRKFSVPTSLAWLAYDSLSGSIPGTICELMNQVSIFTALWRYRRGNGRQGRGAEISQ